MHEYATASGSRHAGVVVGPTSDMGNAELSGNLIGALSILPTLANTSGFSVTSTTVQPDGSISHAGDFTVTLRGVRWSTTGR